MQKDVKLSKKSKQLLKSLDKIREVVHYCTANSPQWDEMRAELRKIEDHLIETCKSRKLQDIELAQKLIKEKGLGRE